jgi:hypothetical protein
MALAIIQTERITRVALLFGKGQRGGGIETAGE